MAAADGGVPGLEIRRDRLLLVEGRDEVNLFGALLEHCVGAEGRRAVQIIDAGGKHEFRKRLMGIAITLRAGPPLRALGVIRDADTSARSAFQSVFDALRHAGYEPPEAPGGVAGNAPAVGVFVLPDGAQDGAVETLCRQSVAGGAASNCVEDYIECLKAGDALRSRNEDKTFAHAWLAACEDPVARVGEGARQGVWDFDAPAFRDLSDFLKKIAL